MAVSYNAGLKKKVLADFATAMAGAELKIYTSPKPATPADTASGTLLVTIPGISWTAPDGEETTMDITSFATGVAVATGTAAWARMTKGNYVLDGTITSNDGGDFVIDSTSISEDSTVTLISAEVSLS